MKKSSAMEVYYKRMLLQLLMATRMAAKEVHAAKRRNFEKQRQSSAMLMSPLLDCTMPLLLLLV